MAFLWFHGYHKGQSSNADKIASIEAVGAAQNAQYRKAEKEVQSALQTLVDRYRAAAVERDSYWMRLKDRSRAMPEVRAEPGSPPTDSGNRVEAAGGSCVGDVSGLRNDLVWALEAGEKLEATLLLCQSELRACASLR
jgi:hypothetical protein